MAASLLHEAGGAARLRAVLVDFYDRVFADVMIGFFFARADKARLVEKELELVLGMLGAGVAYSGEPLAQAHARHPILGGHFLRRLQILKETLADHGVPEAVQEVWIRHTEALRPQITRHAGSDCGVTPKE